jgi:small subunit ribosomal protein S6
MRPYEIVVIFDASLDEPVIRAATDRVADHVKSRGGTPGHVDRWGKRTLAYEIAHRHEGYYVVIDVVAEPDVVAEVGRMLELSDEVLRHKVLRKVEKTARRRQAVERPAAAPAAS